MTSDYAGEARACVICGRILEQLITDDRRLYRHAAIDEPADHLPVAVRLDEAPSQVRFRCDFCLGEPITHTLVVDTELGIPAANVVWDMEWAMCALCADLVMADDWLDLRRRAFAGFEKTYGHMGERTKVEMRLVYRDLRQHLVMIYQEEPA